MKNIGVISPQGAPSTLPSGAKPAAEDAPLLLSKKAQERAYFPEGLLTHHHAVQFVSFAPPFETPVHITKLASSRSQDASLSSLGSMSEDRQDGINVIAALGLPQNEENPPSPKSVIEVNEQDSASFPKHKNLNRDSFDHREATVTRGNVDTSHAMPQPKPRVRGFFSKLNCCRQGGVKNAKGSTPMSNGDSMSITSMTPRAAAEKLHQFREASLTSLSEEEELQWLAYSIQPIAEDQSLTGGSIISMSAPLLKGPNHADAALSKGSGVPSHSRESAGGFPQPRFHGRRDMYEC